MTVRIGVLGAGPAGLTLAVGLERTFPKGAVEVTVVDRNRSDTDYPGVEYGIQARATRALERLGVKEQALRRGQRISEVALCVEGGARQQSVTRVDPTWHFGVLRQEFLADLRALLSSTEVHRGHRVTRLEPLPEGRVRVHAHERPSLDFDCVLAADGVNSVARQSWFPNLPPQDRGFSIIYLLVDGRGRSALPRHFRTRANGGRVQLTMGSFSTHSYYPQGDNRLTLAYGFDHQVRTRLWAEQGLAEGTPWADIDVTRKKAITSTLARDTPFDDALALEALALVDDWNDDRIYLWSMRDSDALQRPWAPDAAVLLLGDAAHAFLPTLGMGASLAIEDAEALLALLREAVSDGRDAQAVRAALRAEVFAPFGARRVPVWNDLMRRSRRAAQNFIGQGSRKRFFVAPYVPARWASAAIDLGERLKARLGAM